MRLCFAGLFGSSIFSFTRTKYKLFTYKTVYKLNCFQSGLAILYFYQQYVSDLMFPYPCNIWSCYYFFLYYPFWKEWNDTMILICISLIANDVDYLSMNLFAICMSSFVKYLFVSFVHWIFFFLWLRFQSSLCILNMSLFPLVLCQYYF